MPSCTDFAVKTVQNKELRGSPLGLFSGLEGQVMENGSGCAQLS